MAIFVNDEAADIKLVLFLRLPYGRIVALETAKLGLDPSHDLQRVEGLGDIVVRADGKAHDLVGVRDLCRQHNDGKIIAFPDFLADMETVDIGKHDVENRKIRQRFLKAGQGICPIIKFVNRVAVVFQINIEKVGDLFFVIDD